MDCFDVLDVLEVLLYKSVSPWRLERRYVRTDVISSFLATVDFLLLQCTPVLVQLD